MKVKETVKPKTGRQLLAELKESGFIGLWQDRDDIDNSGKFSHLLRKRSQQRNRLY